MTIEEYWDAWNELHRINDLIDELDRNQDLDYRVKEAERSYLDYEVQRLSAQITEYRA